MTEDKRPEPAALRAKSHMPETAFYEKVIPAMLIFLGIVMLALIIFALAVLLGYIRF
jgi:hypothetical protein